MTIQSIDGATLWTVIIGLAVGSYLLRFAFIGIVGGRPIPRWLLRHLRYTAVAIIPALVTPLVLWPQTTGDPSGYVLLAAALGTVMISRWRRNVLSGVLAGGGLLAGLPYLGM